MPRQGVAILKGEGIAAGSQGNGFPKMGIQIQRATKQVATVTGGEGERGTHRVENSFLREYGQRGGGINKKEKTSCLCKRFLS
jgi:hypothetical protein